MRARRAWSAKTTSHHSPAAGAAGGASGQSQQRSGQSRLARSADLSSHAGLWLVSKSVSEKNNKNQQNKPLTIDYKVV